MENNPFQYYKSVAGSRSPEQLSRIARLKRFLECFSGYPDFREELKNNPQEAEAVFRAYYLDIDPERVRPLWENGFTTHVDEDKLEDFPDIRLWKDWVKDLTGFRDLMRVHGEAPNNQRFDAWRKRQIARSDSELGDTTSLLTHATLSLELTEGCTVGCWFCGLKSEDFGGAFEATPENLSLWQGVLSVFSEQLGPSAQTGFCYWATEPTDNPDYLTYIQTFKDIVGSLPQTTTACPTKDLDWTREMINLYEREMDVPARFSVLSQNILGKIHAAFSPDELLYVDLIQQHKAAMTNKSLSGRYLEKEKAQKGRQPVPEQKSTGTIACVSGFFVNMKQRRIELVSPCRANDRWPTGYRVHKRGFFSCPEDVEAFIAEAVQEYMPLYLTQDSPIRFRKDLSYEAVENGFSLSNDFRRVRFCGDFHRRLGELVAEGGHSFDEIVTRLLPVVDFFAATQALQTLFDKGLLDDLTDDNSIRT